MTVYCCAKFCKNNTKHNRELAFFSFPKDAGRFRNWLQLCGRDDLLSRDPTHVSKNILVCSAHFQDTAFVNPYRSRSRLLPTAMPSLFQNLSKEVCYKYLDEDQIAIPEKLIHNHILEHNYVKSYRPESERVEDLSESEEELDNAPSSSKRKIEEPEIKEIIFDPVPKKPKRRAVNKTCAASSRFKIEPNEDFEFEEEVIETETPEIIIKEEPGSPKSETVVVDDNLNYTMINTRPNKRLPAAIRKKPLKRDVMKRIATLAAKAREESDDSSTEYYVEPPIIAKPLQLPSLGAASRVFHYESDLVPDPISKEQFLAGCAQYLPANLVEIVRQQVHFNECTNMESRRYSDEFKWFALSMYGESRRAYKTLSKYLILPSGRTLERFVDTIAPNVSKKKVYKDLSLHGKLDQG